MNSYWIDEQQKKILKLDCDPKKEEARVYWVQVCATEGGGFIHARGCDVVSVQEKAEEILRLTAEPAQEQDYITALKDYFAADKKVREQFIKTFKL